MEARKSGIQARAATLTTKVVGKEGPSIQKRKDTKGPEGLQVGALTRGQCVITKTGAKVAGAVVGPSVGTAGDLPA